MSLLELDISNNDFSDSIPNSFSNVSFLKYLQLDGNQFTGNILNSLSNCSFLEVSDISDNHLSGVIPEWMGNMPSLAILDLSRNDISGYLSSNFNPPQLLHVYLSENRIQGTISKAFYNCFELEVLDLRNNLLNGTIPKWIGERLSLLSYVSLSYNNFEGTSEIFSRKSVERQPNPLEFTTKWMTYSFQRSILLFFSGIDLSVNKLIGEIPPEIGNFEEIKVLNLSHNNLIGQVPSTFGNLNQIESLDISYNNLNWKIPLQITQLHSLEVFSVAFNNLSGKTPDRVAQFATFDKSSYEGNPYLCGLPLPNTCNATLSPPLMPGVSTYEKQEENGFIDMNIFFISFSVAYLMVLLSIAAVLCINPQWRQAWFWFVEASCYNPRTVDAGQGKEIAVDGAKKKVTEKGGEEPKEKRKKRRCERAKEGCRSWENSCRARHLVGVTHSVLSQFAENRSRHYRYWDLLIESKEAQRSFYLEAMNFRQSAGLEFQSVDMIMCYTRRIGEVTFF
ncbi:receptor-like protein 13 [Jatropha curcas]|uniref:receptor-like protein 13 n=1 Tax=Jatropha curcas TaxID=180498 RepID=UPI001894E262|nr:receptor-like protein 13 [Jatropha curcas]